MTSYLRRSALIGVLVAIPLGFLAGSALIPGHLLVMPTVALAMVYLIGRGSAREGDSRWLPSMLVAAMLVKLAGATLRHEILFRIYEGDGDAVAYHHAGIQVAEVWRNFVVPEVESVGSGSFGTHFVGWLTGLFYAPFEPSSLGGFWMFAILAFLGQVFFYLALRSFTSPPAWRRYAVLIFFWPTLVYWPSSIGKEALLIFLLGICLWGAAQLYRRFKVAWLIPIAAAAGVAGIIRIHVAALAVGSILIGAVLSRGPRGAAAGFRKIGLVALGIAAMFPLVFSVAQQFGVSLDGPVTIEDLDPAFSDIEAQTQDGDSAVDTGAIRSPADVPAAVLKVLFRPLPNEVANLQTAAASVEGLLLIGLLVWRMPQMVRNAGRALEKPYIMMASAYSAGFIFAWSAISNLGIMTRQRSLLLPVLFVIIVALGWKDSVADDRGDLERRLMDRRSREDADAATPRKADRPAPVA